MIIKIFFLLTAAYSQESFYNCVHNNDCTYAVGNCEEIVSINKKSIDKKLYIRNKTKNTVLCSSLTNALEHDYMISECLKGECKLRTTRLKNEKVKNISEDKIAAELERVSELKNSKRYYECLREVILLKNKFGNSEKIERIYQECKGQL